MFIKFMWAAIAAIAALAVVVIVIVIGDIIVTKRDGGKLVEFKVTYVESVQSVGASSKSRTTDGRNRYVELAGSGVVQSFTSRDRPEGMSLKDWNALKFGQTIRANLIQSHVAGAYFVGYKIVVPDKQ